VSGTAEQFRPYYDIMSAPNSGLVCLGLEGLCMERAIGEDAVSEVTGPFVGPYSVLDIPGISSAALGNTLPLSIRETILRDGDIDMWDAPMPPALVNVDIRGAGYLRQVRKQDVYYLGIPDMQGPGQSFPNLFYRSNIPDSPFIPAVVAGGGYLWDSWGNDGPGGSGQGAHEFWTPVLVGVNTQGAGDPTLTADDLLELEGIAAAADDSTIARTLVVYSDNHGEFMVAANGRFKAAAGSCQPNPVAGTSTITAVADYPDFRGKHFTVASNVATVNWTPDAVSIGSLSPSTVVAGSENVQLSLTGSGFVTGVSQLCVNGVPASTTVISATSLEAILQGPTQAATYQIRVANPVAGGGVSNTLLLLGTVQPTSVTEIAVVTNDDPEETATVSTPPPAPQASPVVTVQTSPGTGTVAVAIYETNPGETPSFAIGTGGAPGTYVDAYVSPSSTFASATIVICDPNGGDVAYWWDGWAWSPADDQSFDADTGCITVTVTTATSPKITDLSGTVFAAALGYAPMIESVSVSPGLVTVGTPVTASVVFSDLDLPGDLHVATWDWGDGSTSQANANAAATHQYQGPGVYTVVVTVTDADGATASSTFRYVVVFDAAGGFVTGGGWIASPAGAYAADPALTGKATFGFVSQYKKGQQVPSGNTEFQFSAGRLNFKSTSYEWLVVAGSKAQFRGRGTIEGRGDYAFFVTAIDGDSDGGKKPDKFRIRIWDRLNGGLVYDNQLSAPDDAQPTTVLGGGSIVVHR
ncbi:MAG: PKD domain-containing protein, partial [Chloroflexi bacterium]|nr:PKD domain-containing protein [Chloroflexota bacterium]